jgi:DNA-binding MarR family transcriptional regulator
VGQFPGIGAGQLATLLHLDPGTLTGIVQRLERARQLERRSDRSDGRRVVLFLTTRGRTTDAVRGGTVEEGFRLALARLSPRAVTSALAVLETLSEELARRGERGHPTCSGR